ncbi:MAG: PEP-CTERM sorting domain-containing protein [Phycisphaerales bacterium]
MTKTSTKTNSNRRVSHGRHGRIDRGLFAGVCLGLVALPAGWGGARADVGDLYVTEEGPGNVWQFDGLSGTPQGFFNAAPMSGNLMAIHTGGTVGDVLVGSSFGGVYRLDRNTGNVVQTFNASGGWQWAGVWRPNTNTVLIGDMNTDDIREYDANTGAFLGVFATGVSNPADMIFGPDGDLYVCSFTPGAGVYQVNGLTGAVVTQWGTGGGGIGGGFTNDIVFMDDGRRIVTAMGDNMAHVFDSSWNLITSFAGTGWQRIHGITVSPHDGLIYAVDGLTTNVHSFDPITYAEVDVSFASTHTKPVDLEFRPAIPAPGTLGLLAAAGLVAGRRRRSRGMGAMT